jgi:hypothetical protein
MRLLFKLQKKYPDIIFKHLNMIDINNLKQKYDGIICFGNTLVHLEYEQIETFLHQAYQVLNNEGKLLIQILNFDYIKGYDIKYLPIIQNDRIRFERKNNFNGRVLFNTKLTVKSTGEYIENMIPLTPIKKQELNDMLQNEGFGNIKFYSAFDKKPYDILAISLLISCVK